jgi:pyruvate dehydrogenase E1 component alpha subunit
VIEPGIAYRTKEEMGEWKKKCPIERLQRIINERNILTEKEIDQIGHEVEKEIDEAVEIARRSDYPSSELLKSFLAQSERSH